MIKNVLLTGASGYIGKIIATNLNEYYNIYGIGGECDLRNIDEVITLSEDLPNIDVVIHAAGLKDLRYCEDNQNDAYEVNGRATANIATIFNTQKIVYVSTDYVFDGVVGNNEERDLPNPQTNYGKSKLLGEQLGREIAGDRFIILRTSAVYDNEAPFITFLKNSLWNNAPVKCYIDAIYSPTYYRDLITCLTEIDFNENEKQIYHVCGERISRYDFADKFANAFKLNEKLIIPEVRDRNNKLLFADLSLRGEILHTHDHALKELHDDLC